MLPSFCKDTVTRIRPGTKTERGSTVPDWGNTERLAIGGCSVQPGTTEMSMDGRVLGIMKGATCYMPAGSDVQEGDRIEHDGVVYEIDGSPKRWRSAGNLDHIQLTLRRWSG